MGRGKTWSGADTQRLTALVAAHTDGDGRVSGWAGIAQAFEGRGEAACLQKWTNISGKGSEQIGKATFSPEVLKRLGAEFVIERDPTDDEIRIFVDKLLAECEDTTRVNFETLKTWFYNKRYFDPITWGKHPNPRRLELCSAPEGEFLKIRKNRHQRQRRARRARGI